MKATYFPPAPCVECGAIMHRASRLGEVRDPEPHDAAICVVCHHLMVFADDMKLRNPTDDEIVEMAGDPDVIRHMKALGPFKQFAQLIKDAIERHEKTGSIQGHDGA
jgi:hypothetical protein